MLLTQQIQQGKGRAGQILDQFSCMFVQLLQLMTFVLTVVVLAVVVFLLVLALADLLPDLAEIGVKLLLADELVVGLLLELHAHLGGSLHGSVM